jgi:hypothetical protein
MMKRLEMIVCEMCEVKRIRFAHIMRHPDYPHELRVCTECAGRMSGDPDGARRREAVARFKAGATERI